MFINLCESSDDYFKMDIWNLFWQCFLNNRYLFKYWNDGLFNSCQLVFLLFYNKKKENIN